MNPYKEMKDSQCNIVGHQGNSRIIAICKNSDCQDKCYICGICAIELHQHSKQDYIKLTDLKKYLNIETSVSFAELGKQIKEQLNNVEQSMNFTNSINLDQPLPRIKLEEIGRYLRNWKDQIKQVTDLQARIIKTSQQIVLGLDEWKNKFKERMEGTNVGIYKQFLFDINGSLRKVLKSDGRGERILMNPAINQMNLDIINIKFKINACHSIDIGITTDKEIINRSSISNDGYIYCTFKQTQHNTRGIQFAEGQTISCVIDKRAQKVTFTNLERGKSCTLEQIPMQQAYLFIISKNSEIEILD